MLFLVHISVEIHLLKISMNCRWIHEPPLHPILGFNDELLFVTRFHSTFPKNLTMSSHQLCCTFSSQASWVWGILAPIRSESRSDMMVGTYFQQLLHWSLYIGKVRSCLSHLAGGLVVIDSFSARLSLLPWGNCKTYSSSQSWWILCVSRVWSSPVDHVNAISKHVCGTPIFNKEYLKPNAKCFSLNYPNTIVWVMSWNFSHLTWRVFYIISLHGYHALLVLGNDIPLKYVFRHIVLSIILFKLMITFSFPLFCLTLLVIYMI